MEITKLYIIGNGFDLYHGVKSSYADFKDYVRNNDRELFCALDELFDTNALWSNFEETLADIDMDTIIGDAEDSLISYAADDWSDRYHHEYQCLINEKLELVTERLRKHFTDWILTLLLPSSPAVNINPNALFLTFNYTATLENAYKIPSDRILYIHNKAIDDGSVLILGHSRLLHKEDSFSRGDAIDTDTRVMEGNHLLDRYFIDTYKDTNTIIADNRAYFDSLECIREVFVLGHSLSDVDARYFEELKRCVDSEGMWKISYYGEGAKKELRDAIVKFGIEASRIMMVTLDEL